MRLTKRGQLLAGLTLGAMTMLGGTMAEENTPMNTDHRTDLVIYEDGSAVRYDGDTEVGTYPAETFCWTSPTTHLTYSCPVRPE